MQAFLAFALVHPFAGGLIGAFFVALASAPFLALVAWLERRAAYRRSARGQLDAYRARRAASRRSPSRGAWAGR